MNTNKLKDKIKAERRKNDILNLAGLEVDYSRLVRLERRLARKK